MKTLGWEGAHFHMPDKKEDMFDTMKGIMEMHGVVILSGGVSKGRYDFVPEVLEEIGVTKLFQGVNQRPGKPFWFGVSKKGTIIFALPGNPVSTFMCFYRYIKPWLFKSVGMKDDNVMAVLAEDFLFSGNLVYFLQVAVQNENGRLMAHPVEGGGSGDFANLKHVQGFLELPAQKQHFIAGEAFPYFSFR
jgi:molybdopterin molybdotransferase